MSANKIEKETFPLSDITSLRGLPGWSLLFCYCDWAILDIIIESSKKISKTTKVRLQDDEFAINRQKEPFVISACTFEVMRSYTFLVCYVYCYRKFFTVYKLLLTAIILVLADIPTPHPGRGI